LRPARCRWPLNYIFEASLICRISRISCAVGVIGKTGPIRSLFASLFARNVDN
jgi:hypothetical protein